MDLYSVIVLIAVIGLTSSTSDIFSSTAQLRLMAAQESTLADTVQHFIQKEEQRIQAIKQ